MQNIRTRIRGSAGKCATLRKLACSAVGVPEEYFANPKSRPPAGGAGSEVARAHLSFWRSMAGDFAPDGALVIVGIVFYKYFAPNGADRKASWSNPTPQCQRRRRDIFVAATHTDTQAPSGATYACGKTGIRPVTPRFRFPLVILGFHGKKEWNFASTSRRGPPAQDNNTTS